MHSPERDEVEQIAVALDLQARKLEQRGVTLSAALLRIARVDLQMHIRSGAEEEVDVFNFALEAINRAGAAKRARSRQRAFGKQPGYRTQTR